MNRHIILFLLFASPACAAEFPARVVGIAGGDTLTVLTAGRTQLKIRLSGIDAPESGQDFGTRAKQAASSMAIGKTVTVIERDTDRYGRTLAEIILPDGRSMNREMVGQGMALVVPEIRPRRQGAGPARSRSSAAKTGPVESIRLDAAMELAQESANNRQRSRQPAESPLSSFELCYVGQGETGIPHQLRHGRRRRVGRLSQGGRLPPLTRPVIAGRSSSPLCH